MSVHVPEAAQMLLELVVGSDWPDGDEDALRALSGVWSDAANELEAIQHTVSGLASSVGDVAKGAAADAFAAYWAKNIDDGSTSWGNGASPPILPFSIAFCRQMAKACDDGALEIETAKEMVIGQLLLLAAELAGTDVLGMFTFGLADLGDIAEVAASRVVCKEIINEAVTKVVQRILAAAIEMGVTQGVLDLAIQTIQVAEHHRSFSAKELLESAGSGALAGGLGAGFGLGMGALGRMGGQEGANMLGRALETKAGTVVTAVAGGGFTNAAMDLAQNHTVSLSDLTKGSLGGAIGAAHGLHADVHLTDTVSGTEIPAAATGSALSTDAAPATSLHTVLAGLDTHFDPDGSVHQEAPDISGTASAPVSEYAGPSSEYSTAGLSGIQEAASGLVSPDSGIADATSIAGTGVRLTTSADVRPETGSFAGGGRTEASASDVSIQAGPEQLGARVTERASFAAPVEDRVDTAALPSTADRASEPSLGTPREDGTQAAAGPRPEPLTGDRAAIPESRASSEPVSVGEPVETAREDVSAPSSDRTAETSPSPSTATDTMTDPATDTRDQTGLSGGAIPDRGIDRVPESGESSTGRPDVASPENEAKPVGADATTSGTGDNTTSVSQLPANGGSAGAESGGGSGVVVGAAGRSNEPSPRASSADAATQAAPSRTEVPPATRQTPESVVQTPVFDRAPDHGGQRPADPVRNDQGSGTGSDGGSPSNASTAPVAAVIPVDVRVSAAGHDAAALPDAASQQADALGRAQAATPAQPVRDPRPPLSSLREVGPGRQGVIDPADQAEVERRFPRDEQGNPLPFRDPRENQLIEVANDGGPLADPFRANNCADQACAQTENWYGDPQVSAPRHPEYVNGEPSTAGEDGGIQKIEALAGAKLGYDGPAVEGYQHLADRLREAGHGAAAIIVVDWGNGSSHAFNAFNHDGTILWTDAQSGLVSEDTPLWPQAQHVWSVGTDAERNPLPGYEPLDTEQAQPEIAQSPDISDQQLEPDTRTAADSATPFAQTEGGLDRLEGDLSQVNVRDPRLPAPDPRVPAPDPRVRAEGPTPEVPRQREPGSERLQPASRPADPGAPSTAGRDHAGNDPQLGQDGGRLGHDVTDSAVPDYGLHGYEAAAVIDAARHAAALTRTDAGGFAPDAVEALLDGLPSLPDNSQASISALVEKVFPGDVRLQLLDGRARSERPVYRAYVDGELVGFVKVVPHADEFAAELSAADRLQEAGLSAFHTPDLLAVATVPGPDDVRRGVLFSSDAPGVSIDALLRRVPLAWDRDSAMADVRSAVGGVAEGLAELHSAGGDRPASPDYLMPHADAIRSQLSELANHREALARLGIDIDRIHAEAENAIAAALADPGPASLAHGDAHLGNFLWDEHAGVSLIDAPTLHASMDAAGGPIGSAARDFALFDQRIGHFGEEFGLTPEQISDLRREFAESYARHGGPVVPEHVQALFEARAATHRLARAVQRLENRPEDVRNGPAVGAAGAALQHALGLDDSEAGRVGAGFAGELPGTPEFRRDWVAIDNVRSYMRRVADPEIRERFETEFGDRIAELQHRQSEQFKKLWKDLFPNRKKEAALTPEGGRRAAELLGGFTAEADGLMRDLTRFAAETGIPALAPDALRATIDREGTAAWEASLRETQAKINEVIAGVTYHGQQVGFIGSMTSGWRGAHKGKTHFDPHDFDVDLYVVVDQETYENIAATYPELDNDGVKIMPNDKVPPDLIALAAQIGRALKEKFPDTPGIEDSTIALRSQQPW